MSTDKPKDPIIEEMRRAKEEQKAKADAAAGEKALVVDFQREANKCGPTEVEKIDALFAARCETLNANKEADDPEFVYEAATHQLRNDKFAVYLELTEGCSPYRLDMVSGLRRDARQVFASGFKPERETTNWKLLAQMDDTGFFWNQEGTRLSSEQVAEEGLNALAGNIVRALRQ
jgi:hypothetical protein